MMVVFSTARCRPVWRAQAWCGMTKSRSYDGLFSAHLQVCPRCFLLKTTTHAFSCVAPMPLALARRSERGSPKRPLGTLHAGARRRRLIDRLIDRLLSAVYHAGSIRPRLQAINILLLQSLKSMENKRKSWLEQRRKQLYQTLRKPLFEISRKAFAGASGKLMQV
jgi:hypothetical protein